MGNADPLTDVQKSIIESIPKGDVGELKTLLTQLQGTADFVDENGMTPLQHACYKGNTELVQILLDQVIECVMRFIIEMKLTKSSANDMLRLCCTCIWH